MGGKCVFHRIIVIGRGTHLGEIILFWVPKEQGTQVPEGKGDIASPRKAGVVTDGMDVIGTRPVGAGLDMGPVAKNTGSKVGESLKMIARNK